jgi:hypothetical protein
MCAAWVEYHYAHQGVALTRAWSSPHVKLVRSAHPFVRGLNSTAGWYGGLRAAPPSWQCCVDAQATATGGQDSSYTRHQLPSGGSCAAQLVQDACAGQHSVLPTAATGTLCWQMYGVQHNHCYSRRMYRQWPDLESRTGDNTPQLALALWHEGHSRWWSQHGSAMHFNMPTWSQQRQLAADEPQKQRMRTRQ